MVRIEPFLLDDETLLGSCGTGRGLVCATDLRLLRVERTPFGRRIRDLSYGEVGSVAITDEISLSTILLGVVLFVLGLALPRVATFLLPMIDPVHPLRFTAEGARSLFLVAAAVVALGGGLVGLGAFWRRCYVSLHGPGLLRQRRHRRDWRFATPTASDARVFAMLVRRRLGNRSRIAEKKVLPFDSV